MHDLNKKFNDSLWDSLQQVTIEADISNKHGDDDER